MPDINLIELVYATIVAALTAFVCIYYFLKLIANFSLMPFVVYRLLFGLFLLFFFCNLMLRHFRQRNGPHHEVLVDPFEWYPNR